MSFSSEHVPDPFGPIIRWDGGQCPVDHDTIVRCHFRGRAPYVGKAIHEHLPGKYAHLMWMHAPMPNRNDPNMDIIGYQVFNG